jgi:type II secretory pathway pseudopilin PulG
MVTIMIISVLSSAAIPAYLGYLRKSKSSEAPGNVRKMYDSSRSYFVETQQKRASTDTVAPQFPTGVPVTPAPSCCFFDGDKCPPNPLLWAPATWQSLRFSVDEPHYYRYAYDSTGTVAAGATSNFTARALGDLDCDTQESTFEMTGTWAPGDGDVHGSGGLYIKDQLE